MFSQLNEHYHELKHAFELFRNANVKCIWICHEYLQKNSFAMMYEQTWQLFLNMSKLLDAIKDMDNVPFRDNLIKMHIYTEVWLALHCERNPHTQLIVTGHSRADFLSHIIDRLIAFHPDISYENDYPFYRMLLELGSMSPIENANMKTANLIYQYADKYKDSTPDNWPVLWARLNLYCLSYKFAMPCASHDSPEILKIQGAIFSFIQKLKNKFNKIQDKTSEQNICFAMILGEECEFQIFSYQHRNPPEWNSEKPAGIIKSLNFIDKTIHKNIEPLYAFLSSPFPENSYFHMDAWFRVVGLVFEVLHIMIKSAQFVLKIQRIEYLRPVIGQLFNQMNFMKRCIEMGKIHFPAYNTDQGFLTRVKMVDQLYSEIEALGTQSENIAKQALAEKNSHALIRQQDVDNERKSKIKPSPQQQPKKTTTQNTLKKKEMPKEKPVDNSLVESMQHLLDQGHALFKAGQLQEALAEYTKCKKIAETNKNLLFILKSNDLMAGLAASRVLPELEKIHKYISYRLESHHLLSATELQELAESMQKYIQSEDILIIDNAYYLFMSAENNQFLEFNNISATRYLLEINHAHIDTLMRSIQENSMELMTLSKQKQISNKIKFQEGKHGCGFIWIHGKISANPSIKQDKSYFLCNTQHVIYQNRWAEGRQTFLAKANIDEIKKQFPTNIDKLTEDQEKLFCSLAGYTRDVRINDSNMQSNGKSYYIDHNERLNQLKNHLNKINTCRSKYRQNANKAEISFKFIDLPKDIQNIFAFIEKAGKDTFLTGSTPGNLYNKAKQIAGNDLDFVMTEMNCDKMLELGFLKDKHKDLWKKWMNLPVYGDICIEITPIKDITDWLQSMAKSGYFTIRSVICDRNGWLRALDSLGFEHLKNKIISIRGDASKSLQEDPVRILKCMDLVLSEYTCDENMKTALNTWKRDAEFSKHQLHVHVTVNKLAKKRNMTELAMVLNEFGLLESMFDIRFEGNWSKTVRELTLEVKKTHPFALVADQMLFGKPALPDGSIAVVSNNLQL